MNVVGLDIAYGDPRKRTGTGVATSAGTTTVSSKLAGMARLAALRDALLLACAGAHLVGIEGYAFASLKSQAHALGELGGVVRLALWEAGILFIDVSPASVKIMACGKGNASKDDVLLAAVRRLGYEGNSKDEADALWVRATVLAAVDEPIVSVPQSHLRALIPIRKMLALAP